MESESESVSRSVMSNSVWPHGPKPARLLCPQGFSKKDYLSGWPFPSPGIFLTPGSKLSLLSCRQILYHLSHQGSPANWWDALKTATPATGIGQQKVPSSPWQSLTAYRTANASKVEGIGIWSMASSATFTRPLVNGLPLLQSSWQRLAAKILPEPSGGRKCFPRVCQIPKHSFYALGINKLILSGRNLWIVIIPISINKDAFETSLNYLKFTVWNCNYVCTDLTKY